MKLRNIKLYSAALLVAGSICYSCSDMEKEYEGEAYPTEEISVNDFSPLVGRPGTEVSISGLNFGDRIEPVSVSFNGVQASEIISVMDNEIVTKVPENAIDGPITVKVWNHEKHTVEEFDYIPGGHITSLEPNEGKVGDVIKIIGENFGSNLDEVEVFFTHDVMAQILSVSDSEISLVVPDGGMTGNVTLKLGPQVVEGPEFNYPLVGIESLFDEDGNAEGWLTSQNSTSEVKNGYLNVAFDPAQFSGSKRRADLKLQEGVKIDVGNFPILAIKIDKPEKCNFIFDTNYGTYDGGKNNWTGILIGDVYYFDLSAKPFKKGSEVTNLSTVESTDFTSLQFKIADITSDEKGYSVDWIKSFENVEALKAYTKLPVGKYIFEFDDPNEKEWNTTHNSTNVIEGGKLKVTFDSEQFNSNKRRADLAYVLGGNLYDQPKSPWIYSQEYPIVAIKYTKPSTGVLKPDMTGGNLGNNLYKTDFVDDDVYYYDLSEKITESSKELSTFQFKIADITSDELGYEVDWVRTFKSADELRVFLGK